MNESFSNRHHQFNIGKEFNGIIHDIENLFKKNHKKPNINNTSCSYNMNPIELQCYKNNYPDITSLNNQQLQQHWSTTGCKQQRNNQCPSFQNISGNYTYQGCYNNNNLPNYRGTVTTVDQCSQLAEKNSEIVFGLYDNGKCYTGYNIQEAEQYGQNYNKNSCDQLGGEKTSQIYVRGQPFVKPLPPIPQLTQQNFHQNFV